MVICTDSYVKTNHVEDLDFIFMLRLVPEWKSAPIIVHLGVIVVIELLGMSRLHLPPLGLDRMMNHTPAWARWRLRRYHCLSEGWEGEE